MVALLAADGLSGYPLSRLAQVSPGAVYAVLATLENLAWVDQERREAYASPVRFAYALNGKGRASVTLLLGLPAEAARLAPEGTGDGD
jgi:DNA-binding PadR family transcriptional regulator